MKAYPQITRLSVVILISIILSACCASPPVQQQAIPEDAAFMAIPLGTKGGLNEADLSSYLLAPAGSTDFIALDAGTLFAGLQKAVEYGSLSHIPASTDPPLSLAGTVLLQHVKAYVISHAHLDHVAGLVHNSPDDSKKNILGLPVTINNIRDHLFNWEIWPNFGDEGEGFQLKKYHYVRLTPGQPHEIEHTEMTVTAYTLSHSAGYLSTAFLVESDGQYVLYFGDTGPDSVEKSQFMQEIWQRVAQLVKKDRLRGIFLEASYPSDRPDKQLFGHLTPKWLLTELRKFAEFVDPEQPETALQGVQVVVTHIKPVFNPSESPAAEIMREFAEMNDLGVEFILPETGKRILF